MNKEEKENIRQIILGKIATLKKNIETFKDLSRPVPPDNAIGRLTRMEAINIRSINEASLAKSKQTLIQLNRSLLMINDPDFGYCIKCEEPIPYKRLMIIPEVPVCVPCLTKMNGGH